MEGRRCRAQRLTQNNIEEQTGGLDIQQQDVPEQEAAAVVNHSAPVENGGVRRRRQQEAPKTPPKEERPIPRMPKLDEKQTARVISTKPEEKTENKKMPAPKALNTDKLKKAACAAAKTGKTLLETLGGLIVLLSIMARDGLKKLVEEIRRRRQGERESRQNRSGGGKVIAEREYTLEPVRPEDYHGRGKAHAQQATAGEHGHLPKKKSGAKQHAQMINRITSAALVCVALFSAWQIGSIVLRSVRTNRLNEELSQQRAALIEEQQEMPVFDAEEPVVEAVVEPAIAAEPMVMEAPTAEPEAAAEPAATAAPDIVKTTKYRRIGGDALPEMAALYEKNRDLVAWIQIPDVLDLPVVYRNNDYYLTRDFNKQKNASGTIFLDVNHPFKEKTQNLLLHGHNMKDGTMFGRLAQYLYDDTYLRNHPFIYFDTLWHKEQYVIFAILNVSLKPGNERFFNYFTHDTFSSDTEFSTYIRQLQLRSRYAIPIDVVPSDALLTLSTCLDDDRLVIVARRLRENETRSDLRTLIRMATKQ